MAERDQFNNSRCYKIDEKRTKSNHRKQKKSTPKTNRKMNKFKKYVLVCLCLFIPFTSPASIGSSIKSGLNKVLPNSLKKWIPGLSPEEKTAQLMEEQVKTSTNVLAQMKEAANSMLALRRKIEQANSIKNDGKALFKDLANAKYGKVSLGISEKISGISLNPSDYIPSLDSTRALKRDCSFSCYREKYLLGSIDAFTNRSGNFLGKKPQKGLNGLCSDIQRELLRSDKIKIAAKESNNKLIPIYQEQINNLEIQNKKIDATLKNPNFYTKDPVKYFQLESIKNKNILDMGTLVERINRLQVQSEEVSKKDKEAIAELYSEKLNKDLIEHIIKSKIERNSKF